ncbi:MAG: M14 family metallopeptidase [Alphaproteobacteria bacterium]|nr:M14 family metallopeptidase [Alphaproteobacteria bacterium]
MDELHAARMAFSTDYADARRRFRETAAAIRAPVRSYDNPNRGPDGGTLTTDCAWIGPQDAAKVLILISATHGVEGFCGSGCEIDWLAGERRLAPATAVLVIHAINPHGFAWIRRVTEEGVDLNRNFVDFTRPLPENPGYDALADAILPPALEGPERAAADAKLAAFRQENGQTAFAVAVSGGQYKHPKGLFYGGSGPTWANRTLGRIVDDYAIAGRGRVAAIDYHTGIGPHGYGELICVHEPGSPAAARAKAWWGDSVTEPLAGTSTAGARHGFCARLLEERLGDRFTFIALEYGTYPSDTHVRPALRADHWLHVYTNAEWDAPQTRAIKAQIRKAFYPDTEEWREAVLFRSRQTIRLALAGLSG